MSLHRAVRTEITPGRFYTSTITQRLYLFILKADVLVVIQMKFNDVIMMMKEVIAYFSEMSRVSFLFLMIIVAQTRAGSDQM